MKPTLTAKQIRERFQSQPAAFITAVRSLPASVGDYWEKVSETKDGKRVTRRIAYVSGPGLRDFIRTLPQGQDREFAAALSQTLASVASGLSVLETGVYRLTEAGGKFPWKVEGSHLLSFVPGMATPPPKTEVREFPVNEAFAAIAAAEAEERERVAAEAEAVRVRLREEAAEGVREAMRAVETATAAWKEFDEASAALPKKDAGKKAALEAAASALETVRSKERSLARMRAIAAAI